MTRDEALAALRESGYGVVEDGQTAVIVIDYKPREGLTPSKTTATRYSSAEQAAKYLLNEMED